MNPEPLDFNFKNFFERFKEVYNTLKKDLGWERKFGEFIKDIKNLEEDIDDCESSVLDYEYCVKLGMYYMYLKVKSACEFYLKYMDKPKLLKKENIKCEYSKKVVEISQLPSGEWVVFFEDGDFLGYNEWLFKLAFKDVFEDNKGDKDENN